VHLEVLAIKVYLCVLWIGIHYKEVTSWPTSICLIRCAVVPIMSDDKNYVTNASQHSFLKT